MYIKLSFRAFAVVALCVLYALALCAQTATDRKTLVVNGHTVDGAVAQIDGRSYVDVESFARAMNATVSFEPGRVVLKVPASVSAASPDHVAPVLSRDFARSGISFLAEASEWKAAIESAIRSGVAGGNWLGPWLHDHRVRAEASLNQVSLAVRTEADQKALQLLRSEFARLGELDSNTQATIQSLNAEKAVNPSAAKNDPLLTQIHDCSTFLDVMLVSGEFSDSPSCH
jgi:hypothetical protein